MTFLQRDGVSRGNVQDTVLQPPHRQKRSEMRRMPLQPTVSAMSDVGCQGVRRDAQPLQRLADQIERAFHMRQCAPVCLICLLLRRTVSNKIDALTSLPSTL